jgi:hypothetical protein
MAHISTIVVKSTHQSSFDIVSLLELSDERVTDILYKLNDTLKFWFGLVHPLWLLLHHSFMRGHD